MYLSWIVALGLAPSLLGPAAFVPAAPAQVLTTEPKASMLTSSKLTFENMGNVQLAATNAAIAAVLARYQDALNTSSVDEAMTLYTSNAVTMAPHSPSVIGIDAIQRSYRHGMQAVRFRIRFHIAEIVPMAPDWAFARTNSAGTITVRATGAKTAEANQELFVFQKISGRWKIARYSFSSTSP